MNHTEKKHGKYRKEHKRHRECSVRVLTYVETGVPEEEESKNEAIFEEIAGNALSTLIKKTLSE